MPTDDNSDLVEAQIRAARARGAFDDLEGHGKPLDLEPLPGANAEQRFEGLLMRSLGEVAPEVALAREIRECRKSSESAGSTAERDRMLQVLRSKFDELAATLKARKK
jgi:hypothetical protein